MRAVGAIQQSSLAVPAFFLLRSLWTVRDANKCFVVFLVWLSRMDSDSDKEVESEEDVEDPYPLEGKYKNEEDRRE